MYEFVIQHKDFIGLVIQTLVAIGTCGAIIASLYIATKQNRLKARASVSIMKMVGGDNSYLVKSERFVGAEYITFFIQNPGTRPLILQSTSFYFEFKRKDKRRTMILPFDMYLYTYPIILNQGETRSVVLNSYEDFLTQVATDSENYKTIHKFKAYYVAGTGEKVYAKIDKNSRERIIKDATILIESQNKVNT